MNKIGILTCIHSNNVCARVGCLAAFQNKTDFFQDYPEDTCLAAMMTCNGCKGANPIEPIEDKGILEKIDRLVSEKISTIHVGVCRLPALQLHKLRVIRPWVFIIQGRILF